MLPKGIPIPKEELVRLYSKRHLSLTEVSQKLQVSVHKVTYWMDSYNLKRRPRTVANYYKHNPEGDPFKIKTRLTTEEEKLKYLALGLFWGEGAKTDRHSTRITNTDPALIRKFNEFLLNICQVKPEKVYYWLQTFKDIKVNEAVKFWSKSLEIDSTRIKTCNPIPPQGKGTYRNINRNGVMSIIVGNMKLRKYIEVQLAKLGYRASKKGTIKVK